MHAGLNRNTGTSPRVTGYPSDVGTHDRVKRAGPGGVVPGTPFRLTPTRATVFLARNPPPVRKPLAHSTQRGWRGVFSDAALDRAALAARNHGAPF